MRTFTHDRMIDPAYVPGPGERYASGPKARCVVTKATTSTVYFRYADQPKGGAQFYLDRGSFERRFPGVLKGHAEGSPSPGTRQNLLEWECTQGKFPGDEETRKMTEQTTPRPLCEIAREIQRDYANQGKPVYFAAQPYVAAMRDLYTLDDHYFEDSAEDIVIYALGNLTYWRGPTAKAVKAELKAMLAAHKTKRGL